MAADSTGREVEALGFALTIQQNTSSSRKKLNSE
jgi:hypothetical protein